MSYYDNIYETPQKFGLTVVAVLDSGSGYEWDIACVWRDNVSGDLLGGNDAGCSCNSPWQEVKETVDLIPIHTDRDVDALVTGTYDPSPTDVTEFKRKVREAMG